MRIVGIEGMDGHQIAFEIERGGRFVIYQYCMSVVIMTFKRPSDIYFIPSGENAIKKGLGFSVISLLLGWWGVPWGPIYTIGSFITNFRGGKDVTQEVIASFQQNNA
jgi:hypothetical protein